ncbi:MAG: hypothetical protein HY735_03725 [Verrucomicrobia bacterium]|nr:hypothetical protein [Verrucomicrobiota bacterium]
MQVSPSNLSNLSNIPLALQAAPLRNLTDPTVAAVSKRTEAQEDYYQAGAHSSGVTDLASDTEKRLGRIKEVQVAFKAALNITASIEEQYLLDPIV